MFYAFKVYYAQNYAGHNSSMPTTDPSIPADILHLLANRVLFRSEPCSLRVIQRELCHFSNLYLKCTHDIVPICQKLENTTYF